MDLFETFKPVSKPEWFAQIEKDLKGKPSSDLALDFGEVKVDAFHHLTDRVGEPAPLASKAGWEIGFDLRVGGNPDDANRDILSALAHGVMAPRLILENDLSMENMVRLLQNVHLEMVSVHFLLNGKANAQLVLDGLLACSKQQGLHPGQLKASFNWDGENAADQPNRRGWLERLSGTGRSVKGLTVNGKHAFSEEKPVSELVWLISEGEKMLREYASNELAVGALHDRLQFSVFIGQNYFLQIAKLRALRLLWANVMKAYQLTGELPPIEAHLAPASQTDNANTNMIAATTQAMSALIGGADRLTVLPSDAFSGASSAFSERIALNVQHILALESHFGAVADPAAGSYFIERLTVELAEKAWEQWVQND